MVSYLCRITTKDILKLANTKLKKIPNKYFLKKYPETFPKIVRANHRIQSMFANITKQSIFLHHRHSVFTAQ